MLHPLAVVGYNATIGSPCREFIMGHSYFDNQASANHAEWITHSLLDHLNLLLPRVNTMAGRPLAPRDRDAQLYAC